MELEKWLDQIPGLAAMLLASLIPRLFPKIASFINKLYKSIKQQNQKPILCDLYEEVRNVFLSSSLVKDFLSQGDDSRVKITVDGKQVKNNLYRAIYHLTINSKVELEPNCFEKDSPILTLSSKAENARFLSAVPKPDVFKVKIDSNEKQVVINTEMPWNWVKKDTVELTIFFTSD